ncbi:uncharacterized protein LOC111820476 [Trichechus manatus latirostris]|uniref:Uncharacterized protein LOC111820476 n=1 Tax=Trichechus manatus latirostris TaxID=127582 RepID=A0A2Y9R550_TRIMA|nr:uncharacterized protein LOC111820476 [Trichechus manatus latirostris]
MPILPSSLTSGGRHTRSALEVQRRDRPFLAVQSWVTTEVFVEQHLRIFADVISYGSGDEVTLDLRWTPNPMTGVLKEEERTQERNGGGGHVRTEAKAGVLLPQTQERQEPPETRTGKEGFCLRNFGGNVALLTPQFWTPSLRNCEGVSFCCLKPASLLYFVAAALGHKCSVEQWACWCFGRAPGCLCPCMLPVGFRIYTHPSGAQIC